MERLFVAGVDTVVGANIAAHLSDRYCVTGISDATKVCVDPCETVVVPNDARAIHHLAASHRPDRIVVCCAAGDSPWHRPKARARYATALDYARSWIQLGHDLDVPVTLIASDAIFCGPWMFHTETSTSYRSSAEADSLRALEKTTFATCPNALIVRTHAYGWSALPNGLGWIESILAALESDRAGLFDGCPHATPILAADLADMLHRAWEADLSGVYHIAGAERTNPYRFVKMLASVFELPPPGALPVTAVGSSQPPSVQVETSLHTRKIRRALGVGMPLVIEGLERLRDQRTSGFDRRLQGGRQLATPKVA